MRASTGYAGETYAAVDDGGFTLIELLVVMIIIGILAAIAIPLFLHQRQNALDTAAKSDLRTVAAQEEGYYANDFTYADLATVNGSGFPLRLSPHVKVTLLHIQPLAYCLEAQNTRSSNVYFYDSAGGGLQPASSSGDCSVTSTGPGGGSMTG